MDEDPVLDEDNGCQTWGDEGRYELSEGVFIRELFGAED